MRTHRLPNSALAGLLLLLVLSLAACGAKEPPQPETAPAEGPGADQAGRTQADVFAYDLSGEEMAVVENLIFQEDVTISGEHGRIAFQNCLFQGSLIHRGGEGARVFLDEDCAFDDGAACLLEPVIQEATMDTDLPKFLIFCDMPEVTCETLGAVITSADQAIRLNGASCPISEAALFSNEQTGELGPYSGQEATAHNVAKWVENGEHVQMHIAVLAAE
jgi:predicted small lipoprotein YifL